MADGKVTSKGQITIPKEVRDRLKLQAGDAVKFEFQPDGRVVLRKRLPAMSLCGMLRRPGQKAVSLEEMDESIGKAISDHVMGSLER
jgi:antitoxin PrlF